MCPHFTHLIKYKMFPEMFPKCIQHMLKNNILYVPSILFTCLPCIQHILQKKLMYPIFAHRVWSGNIFWNICDSHFNVIGDYMLGTYKDNILNLLWM